MNDLKKEQGEEVNFLNVVISEESKKEIAAAKLKNHGLVAKDPEGKVVEILEGHSYGKDKVQAIVSRLLDKE